MNFNYSRNFRRYWALSAILVTLCNEYETLYNTIWKQFSVKFSYWILYLRGSSLNEAKENNFLNSNYFFNDKMKHYKPIGSLFISILGQESSLWWFQKYFKLKFLYFCKIKTRFLVICVRSVRLYGIIYTLKTHSGDTFSRIIWSYLYSFFDWTSHLSCSKF
jgi:hypothetical protein